MVAPIAKRIGVRYGGIAPDDNKASVSSSAPADNIIRPKRVIKKFRFNFPVD